MRKLTILYLVSITSLFIFSSCSDDDDETMVATKLSITEFILNEGCTWKGQQAGDSFDMIRSQSEMDTRIEKTEGSVVNYPDFTRNSILLATGPTSYGVSKIETNLTKDADTQYTLSVDVYTNATTVAEGYRIAVLTPVLSGNVTVVKKTTIH